MQKSDAARCPSHWLTADCTSVFDANFCPPSKLLTPNMCCWSCETLVNIYRTHCSGASHTKALYTPRLLLLLPTSCVFLCVRSWRVHSVCPAWQRTLCSTTSPRLLCCRRSQPCSPSCSASSSNSTRSRCEPSSTSSTSLSDNVIGIVLVGWKMQLIAVMSLLDAVLFRFRPFVYSAFANVFCSVQTLSSSIRMCHSVLVTRKLSTQLGKFSYTLQL